MTPPYSSLNLVLLGPPGSGKTTQARLLADSFAVPHIATGDILRDEVEASTPIGSQAKDSLARGGLVSDRVVSGIILGRLDRAECQRGFILEGYPRTVDQAVLLDGILAELGRSIERVVLLDVPHDDSMRRLMANPVPGEGGLDGKHPEDVIRERIRVWDDNASALVSFYRNRGLLVEVDGTPAVDGVVESVMRAVGAPVGA